MEKTRAHQIPITALLLGWIGGTVLHLQLTALRDIDFYAAVVLLALSIAALWGVLRRFLRRFLSRGLGRLLPRRECPGADRVDLAAACLAMACVMAWSGLLAFGVAGWRAAHRQASALDPMWEGRDVQLEGVVAALPQRSPDSLRFRFRIEQAWVIPWVAKDSESRQASGTGQEITAQLPPQVLLGWYVESVSEGDPKQLPDLRAGERWRLPVRLKAPHGQINPHGFDFEAWMWEQGLQAVGQVRSRSTEGQGEVPQRLGAGMSYPVERWRQAVRDRLWAQGLDPRLTGILSALLLGDQAAIDPIDWDVFQRAGVAHLMSISGLHITLLAGLVRGLLRMAWSHGVWRRRSLCLYWPAQTVGHLGGWLFAWGHSLFSGWGLPAQRTVLMLGVMILLRVRGIHWPWPLVWLWAAAVVLAWDPWAWLQAGFWLSFVAVGVLMASEVPASGPATAERSGQTMRARLSEAGRCLLREQGLITLCLAPLTLMLFHQVSLIGMLTNLVAIPWVTFLITPLALIGGVWPPAWEGGAWCLSLLQDALAGFLSWGLPNWSAAAAPWWVVAVGVLSAILLVRSGPWHLRWFGVPGLLPVMLWSTPLPKSGEVEVLVMDVGQGQAVLVRTAEHAMLYDAGPRYARDMDAGQRVIVPLLRAWNVSLDRLVLSHRDADHTGGADAVLAMQRQAQLMGSLPRSHRWTQRSGYLDCQKGITWVWDEVRFEILHPDPASLDQRDTSNARSCVVSIQTARSRLLLTGDIEAPEEAVLVREVGPKLLSDVLLVPHHGSQTSSTLDFLAATQARWAWVQAGYRNRYGHPAKSVQERYRMQGVQVVETTRCGAITWSSSEPQTMGCERQRRQRYWHHRPSPEATQREQVSSPGPQAGAGDDARRTR